ncbi:putative guanine nucleotide exchange factor [Vairimorpha necatrix]|uniref:Guanine nucleotide exchange factor n=1 Tax=Vairimorpha necatrix TaxID=6039 RepID=A0AAX4JDE4_9MICR
MNKLKILLHDLKSQNKEFLDILYKQTNSEKKLFKQIFSINAYTNTDMFNFLSIYELSEHEDLDILHLIVNLKFFPGEKDTDQVILKYFQVLTKSTYPDISYPLFERFIILLNSSMFSYAISNEIFKYFQKFLVFYPEFLDRAIYNLKDDNMKYRLVLDECNVKYVFMIKDVSCLLLENSKSKYLLQGFYDEIPKWYIRSLDENILGFLYYNFDRDEIYSDLCFKYFSELNYSEIISEFKKNQNKIKDDSNTDSNLDYKSNINYRSNIYMDENCKIQYYKSKKEIEKSNSLENIKEKDYKLDISYVELFNDTRDISGLYKIYGKTSWLILRYHPLTNLRILGEFLCSLKNIDFLKEFTSTFDFTNMNVLVALRLYLSGFYLVGESQIVHRVLEIFTAHFVSFSSYEPKFILNLCFSLLLLNTKMYNPHIKSKPSFEEYLSDFDVSEIPEDIKMQDLYNSIKSSKIKFPEKNETSLFNYEIYTKILTLINQEDKLEIQTSNNNINIYLMDKSLVSSDSLLNISHEKFLDLCRYSSFDYLPLYLKYNKSDSYRFLNIFRYYLSHKGDIEIYRIFLNMKTKKYKNILNEIIKKKLSTENLEILQVLYPEDKNDVIFQMIENNIENISSINNLEYERQVYLMSKKINIGLLRKSQYKIKILREVLGTNPRYINREVIDLFKEIDDRSEDSFYTMISIQKEEDMFNYTVQINKTETKSDEIEIGLDKIEEDLDKLNINTNNLTDSKDDEKKKNVSRNNASDNNVLNIKDYKVHYIEKYSINDTTKLFHFYSSSKFILNQAVIKRHISTGKCLRDSDLVTVSNLDNRLIYLILKSEELNNKEVVNYSLWIINLLSTSIPIFIDFFNRNINILKKSSMKISIIKIFISRLKKVVSGLPLCCECQYDKIEDIELFISRIVDNNITSMEDMEFWYKYKREKLERIDN